MESRKPHVLILPYPSQGHISPMTQFAKRLVFKGVKTTIAMTKYLNAIMHADPSAQIQIETISDGFDEGGYKLAGSTRVYIDTLKVVGSKTVAALMKRLGDSGNAVDAIVYDPFMPWALDVAKQFQALAVPFFTQSFAVGNVYYHVQRGFTKLPVTAPTALPGMPELEVSELPSFISDPDSYPAYYDVLVGQSANLDQADWVLWNSYYKLEQEIIDWMSTIWRVGAVGPTLPSWYLDRRLPNDKSYMFNLFKPNSEEISRWLNNKPNGSVVYVSFGSYAELGASQMEELAHGLKDSDRYFLWVVRTPEEAKLPKGFVEEVRDRGLIVPWCSQLEVLSHESIGCFISHCGLNSVSEGLGLGVPFVAMPQWSDQTTNAKYIEEVWKVGVRVRVDDEGIVRGGEIERCIRELMEGEKSVMMKENSKKWKDLAREAVDEGGTSDRKIDEFVASLSGA